MLLELFPHFVPSRADRREHTRRFLAGRARLGYVVESFIGREHAAVAIERRPLARTPVAAGRKGQTLARGRLSRRRRRYWPLGLLWSGGWLAGRSGRLRTCGLRCHLPFRLARGSGPLHLAWDGGLSGLHGAPGG